MQPMTEEMGTRIQEQVEAYCRVKDSYEAMATFLNAVLSASMKALGISAGVSARAKGKPNFVEKMIRKQDKCPDPIHQFTDLCGARIIVDFTNDIDPACDFIRVYFDIDETNSEDTGSRLGTSEFGYRSVHYIVSLNREKLSSLFEDLELRMDNLLPSLPPELFEHYKNMECADGNLLKGPKFKAEIQVRTLLQHAWAVFSHDRIYKSDFNVPNEWKRNVNRIAATLENADNEFSRTIQGVETYRTYFGAYMTREERESELNVLQTVFAFHSEDRELAHRIARMALSLEKWNTAGDILGGFVEHWEQSPKGKAFKSVLEAYRNSSPSDNRELLVERLKAMRDPEVSSILHDYGQARWKQGEKRGEQYMDWAFELDHRNTDAAISLADALAENRQPSKALAYYEAAFRKSPSDPRALGRYVSSKIEQERNIDFLPLMHPSFEAGIADCRERAKVGVYMPEAFYDMGMFYLLMGKPHESLNAFAAAVQRTDSVSKIEEALSRLEILEASLRKNAPEKDNVQLEWATRFLSIAKVGKLIQNRKTIKGKLDALEKILEDLKEKATTGEDRKYHKKMAEFDAVSDEEKAISEQLEFELAEGLKRLKSAEFPVDFAKKPFLIVAGGCDSRYESRVGAYRSLFEAAFKDYEGTILSGGTTAGISGLVGDLPQPRNRLIQKITYHPRFIPSWTSLHSAYTAYSTDGQGFSALEPIQAWIDMVLSGIDPGSVRLLGINGGRISAFEYRMAVMMGARVGILADSGRAARVILEDPDWIASPNLLSLPTDIETIRLFIRPVPASKMLTPEDREAMAIAAHEEFLKNQKKRYVSDDPSFSEWKDLPESLKDSNFQQIDHIEDKLKMFGYRIEKADHESIEIIEFNEEELDRMAEIEHGRWNLERISGGWKLGDREVGNKISPYLVPWNELTDEVKKWDLQAVEKIPELLKERGYRIVKERNS